MISMRKCLVTDGVKAGRVHFKRGGQRERDEETDRERERECGYVLRTYIPAGSQQTILGP